MKILKNKQKEKETMDKFTKGVLTVIAVGIIGLNVQMMNGGGLITKAHSTEPHNHMSFDIIDLTTAIQNQRGLFMMMVEDCEITEGLGNSYSNGGSPLNSYDIDC